MGLLAWWRQRRDSLKTLETRFDELQVAWDEKRQELARLEMKLAKREQRAAARDLPPEQPRSGEGGPEHPDLVRARALREYRARRMG